MWCHLPTNGPTEKEEKKPPKGGKKETRGGKNKMPDHFFPQTTSLTQFSRGVNKGGGERETIEEAILQSGRT